MLAFISDCIKGGRQKLLSGFFPGEGGREGTPLSELNPLGSLKV